VGLASARIELPNLLLQTRLSETAKHSGQKKEKDSERESIAKIIVDTEKVRTELGLGFPSGNRKTVEASGGSRLVTHSPIGRFFLLVIN
jgi:hypothetical protein